MERTMEIAGQTISFTAIEKRLESLYGRYGREDFLGAFGS
jgi:hypothetical protein